MASVCAEASMAYYDHQTGAQSHDETLRRRSFYLATLYQFFRETSCDIRDIAEDTKEGVDTLPVKLGKKNTILLMALVGLLLDSVLTRSIIITAEGIILRNPHFIYSFLRVGVTMAAYSQILKYPRENYWAWGAMSLFGLLPVILAQAALRYS
jgi:4-hydroxybenzoate polyprenyltransferase